MIRTIVQRDLDVHNIISGQYAGQHSALNALIHRDYSIHTEGMPIQLLLFEDRFEVRSPGGLYGRLRIDQLGKVQPDTRNPVLAVAMETLGETENRYSGIPTMRAGIGAGRMPEPGVPG